MTWLGEQKTRDVVKKCGQPSAVPLESQIGNRIKSKNLMDFEITSRVIHCPRSDDHRVLPSALTSGTSEASRLQEFTHVKASHVITSLPALYSLPLIE
jgi:hypothetical protein